MEIDPGDCVLRVTGTGGESDGCGRQEVKDNSKPAASAMTPKSRLNIVPGLAADVPAMAWRWSGQNAPCDKLVERFIMRSA
jgi:hypothetical protein